MEVYILDSLLRRIEVVDDFESLIWTERFADIGDFEIDIKSTPATRGLFTTGTRLAINNSYRVMTVDNTEDSTDEDGKATLKVKGQSLEAILDDRVAKNTLSDTTTEPKWVITATPGNVARTMFDHICRDGELDPADVIPFLMPGTFLPEDTIPESTTEILWEQDPDSLYNAIKKLVDLYELGFRLVRNFDTSQLYFDIYAGIDRTTRQTILPPVVFSPDLDNLQNTTEFKTTQQAKNVAYVFSEAGFEVVYGENVDPDVEGFERHILVVNADVTVDNPDISGALIQAGQEALIQNRAQSYFDGELNQNGQYVYGIDYNVGDLVEMRNVDGIITYKRVTEQIFVCDAQGERSYPTLVEDMFQNTIDWLSYTNKLTTWQDFEYFGYVLSDWNDPNDLVVLPAGVIFNLIQGTRFYWVQNTDDTRALLGPDGLTRNASIWYDVVQVHVNFVFTDAWSGNLRLYMVDWDNVSRRQTITVTDSIGSQSQSLDIDFHEGAWLEFPVQVNAGGTLDVIVNNDTSGINNAVVSGIFLDDGNEATTWADM